MCSCKKCREKSKGKYKDKCKKHRCCCPPCPPVPPVPPIPPKNKITFIKPFFASTINPKVKTQIIVTGNDMASWLTTNNDLISISITNDNFDLLNTLVDSSSFEVGIFSDCEDLEDYLWCPFYASKKFINPTKSQITEAATLSGSTQGTLHALSGSTSNPEDNLNYSLTETEKLSTGNISSVLIVIQKKKA
jgi:hypothetical protein